MKKNRKQSQIFSEAFKHEKVKLPDKGKNEGCRYRVKSKIWRKGDIIFKTSINILGNL